MATKSLTFTNSAATTVTTAEQLTTTPSGATTGVTCKVGKLTGWGVLWSQGSTATWPALASEPAFGDVHEFLLDDTSLEGQTIQAGTWSFECFFSMSTASVTGEIHFRAGVRHSNGTFTEIVNGTTGSVTVTTSAKQSCTASQASDVTFAVGDKLYIQLDLNITATTSGSTTATFQLHGYNVATNTAQVTPNVVAGSVANTLTASPGSIVITGSPTTLPVGRNLPASPGAYAITGTAAGLVFGRKLPASPGAFSITGSPTTSKVARKLGISPGSYAVTGSPVTPQVGRKLPAAPASYAVTGSATTLPVGRKFPASPASYVISGTATTLVFTPGAGGAVAYTLSVVPGAVAITGSTANLPAGRKMSASPVSYSITGVSTLTPLARKLTVGPGAIAVTGASATLVGSAAPVVQVDINSQQPYVSLWVHPY